MKVTCRRCLLGHILETKSDSLTLAVTSADASQTRLYFRF